MVLVDKTKVMAELRIFWSVVDFSIAQLCFKMCVYGINKKKLPEDSFFLLKCF